VSKKAKPLLYFYLNGNLHKKLQINRGKDTIMTWCYPLHKRVAYTYSEVRRKKEPAFSTKEVAAMMNRSSRALEFALNNGDVEPPQFMYALKDQERVLKYYWSPADVMRVHEYFSNTHYGRPRKDGMITPLAMPTAREVRAMINQETILYIENDDGTFVPTWKAKDY